MHHNPAPARPVPLHSDCSRTWPVEILELLTIGPEAQEVHDQRLIERLTQQWGARP
jgi:hypothetical protein